MAIGLFRPLPHAKCRVIRNSPSTGEAQGNYDEFRLFTGLRPSEQIALVVSDYDAVNGVLSISKARVAGIDRDRTKIAEDRRVVLCPRARAVLARQLRLRETLRRQGRIDHDHLFCQSNGIPIRRLHAVHRPWYRTLKRLAIHANGLRSRIDARASRCTDGPHGRRIGRAGGPCIPGSDRRGADTKPAGQAVSVTTR